MANSYQVIIIPRAQASLERIVDYLIGKYSLKTADKVRVGIMDAIFSLENMPFVNPPTRGVISKKKYHLSTSDVKIISYNLYYQRG